MSNQTYGEWVLPASIPFEDLKRRDLEECVYWLLDAMGAKDLEWRVGGTGDGAADGGRDLEANFYTPGVDGETEAQKWWIECKGRTGTVEASEVKSAVTNGQAIEGLDCLVIATNTQFSNPIRDWVKKWQEKYPRPRIKLWDHSQLERYLSRHPDVVLRLFSQALSPQGRMKAMESRFWNKLEFVGQAALSELWKARDTIEITAFGRFALIANEFANGNITRRPWGAILDPTELYYLLQAGFINVPYLIGRCTRGGADQTPLFRAYAYIILVALNSFSAEAIVALINDFVFQGKGDEMPEHIREFLFMPIADQLLGEMQDVCSSDCRRISCDHSAITGDKDEIKDYWLRLDPAGLQSVERKSSVRLEMFSAPCVVGFPVDKERHCPLFALTPTTMNILELLTVVRDVAAFRKRQAAAERANEQPGRA